MSALVDVLIPIYNRPAALAVTFTGLVYPTMADFRLIILPSTISNRRSDTLYMLDMSQEEGYSLKD